MSLLTVEHLSAGYGDNVILQDVSLHLDAGEVVTLIGPNGAGKSTLMKAIFGLLRQAQGKIRFNGRDISGLSPYRIVGLGMSHVPQTDNVFTSLTVEENLDLGGFLLKRHQIDQRRARIYELFPRLKERRRQFAGSLSGGERQMVAIGAALMPDPLLILLDEPSAGLSPQMSRVVFEKLGEISRNDGPGMLIVEQNARLSLEMSHRGYVLAGGRNRFEATGTSLLENPEIGRLYLGG